MDKCKAVVDSILRVFVKTNRASRSFDRSNAKDAFRTTGLEIEKDELPSPRVDIALRSRKVSKVVQVSRRRCDRKCNDGKSDSKDHLSPLPQHRLGIDDLRLSSDIP
jgi:hypothetical protein